MSTSQPIEILQPTITNGSFEEDRFNHYLKQNPPPTITTPSGSEKTVTIEKPEGNSQTQTNQKTQASAPQNNQTTPSSKLGPIIAIIVGLLLLGGAGLGGTWLFASNILPHWIAQAVGTIGHSGNWGLMIGGGAIGTGLTLLGLYLLYARKNNSKENTNS